MVSQEQYPTSLFDRHPCGLLQNFLLLSPLLRDVITYKRGRNLLTSNSATAYDWGTISNSKRGVITNGIQASKL